MNIEHVTGVSLAPRRLSGQQRDFAVCRRMLGHVVDDNQSMLAAIAKIFRHREGGERRNPLLARCGRCAGDDEDATFRRAVRLHRIDDAFDRGRFLPDRDVDANDVAGLLVDDAVDGNRRFADGAIADDQFALTAPQSEHGVDDEQAGLNRFADEIAIDDRRSGTLHRFATCRADDPATVERTTKRIDNATEQGWPYRHAYHLAAAVDAVPRFDGSGIVEQDAAENIAVERQREADLTAFEAHNFVEPDIGQAGHECNAVGDRLNTTHLLGGGRERRRADALLCVHQPAVKIRLVSANVQLLANAIEVGAPAIAHDHVGATEFDAGYHRRIGAKLQG